MSVILCLGLGHYLLSLGGSTVVAVGSFPLFLVTGLAIGLAAHSMWLVGRMLLPVVVAAFFAGGLLYVPVAAVGTIGPAWWATAGERPVSATARSESFRLTSGA